MCIGFTWCSAESRETHDLTAQIFRSMLLAYLTLGCKQRTTLPFYCSYVLENSACKMNVNVREKAPVKATFRHLSRLGWFWLLIGRLKINHLSKKCLA